MPIPILGIITSSFDTAVSNTKTSSNMRTTTYVVTSQVISVKPNISHKPISDSGKPNRERNREHFGSLTSLPLDEMWVEFQQYMASHPDEHSSSWSHSRSLRGHRSRSPADCSRPSSSFLFPFGSSAVSQGRPTCFNCLLSTACLTYLTGSTCFTCLASMAQLWWSSQPACFTYPSSPICLTCLCSLCFTSPVELACLTCSFQQACFW